MKALKPRMRQIDGVWYCYARWGWEDVSAPEAGVAYRGWIMYLRDVAYWHRVHS